MNEQESKKLEKAVIAELKKYLKKADTVVAGISGGPDSVFILHFLKQLPIKTVAAHVNHSLRKESDAEEKFVKNLCEKWGKKEKLIFESTKKDISKIAGENKKGIEETGRKIRYDFFKKLKKKYEAKYIITAHHADDNLETIILNFVRGAELRGLSGMSVEIKDPKLPLLRPLLQISKARITAYLKLKKIIFKTDKTNLDKKYKRNFVRHEVIPTLQKINPSLTETVTKNAAELKETTEYLSKKASEFLEKNSEVKKLNKDHLHQININAKSFRAQHRSLQKIILLETHKKMFGHTRNISNKHIKETTDMIEKNIGNKKKKLGLSTVEIKKNIIRLKK